MVFLNFAFFLFIGAIGGISGKFLRLPAGTIMGAMFAVGLSKYFGILALEPSKSISFLVQLGLGLMIGITFSKLDKKEVKKLAGGLVVITIGVIVMTFGVGYALKYFTYLDLRTIFLATAPGGIAEMSTVAQAMDLNSPIVAILHVVRLIVVLAIFPAILRYVYKKNIKKYDMAGCGDNYHS